MGWDRIGIAMAGKSMGGKKGMEYKMALQSFRAQG